MGDGPAERTGDFAASMPPGGGTLRARLSMKVRIFIQPLHRRPRICLFSRSAKIMGVAIRGWPKTAIRPNRALEKPNVLFSRFVKITGCPFFCWGQQKNIEKCSSLSPDSSGSVFAYRLRPDTSVFAEWLRPDTSGSRGVSSLSPEWERVG